jgi:hypothetical protein
MSVYGKDLVRRAVSRNNNLVATETVEAAASKLTADAVRRRNTGQAYSEEFERGVQFAVAALQHQGAELRRDFEGL